MKRTEMTEREKQERNQAIKALNDINTINAKVVNGKLIAEMQPSQSFIDACGIQWLSGGSKSYVEINGKTFEVALRVKSVKEQLVLDEITLNDFVF